MSQLPNLNFLDKKVTKRFLTDKEKILLLKGMLFNYAQVTADNTKDEYKSEFWYQQSLEVAKYFKKIKPRPVSKDTRIILDEAYKQMALLDAEYYQDKQFSSYMCMISILYYLVKELRDTSLRVKFGHYEYENIMHDLEKNKVLSSVAIDSHKFIATVEKRLNEKF